ncbi:MAG: DMT family transporter [Bacteroidia bacterium]
MKNNALKAHLALFFVTIFYAANYTIAKEVMPDYIRPFGFILVRVVGATFLYWLFSLMYKTVKIEKKDFPKLMLLGLFGAAANQLLFFKGLNITTPVNASIIMISNPIIVALFSAFFLKERISSRKFSGILFGIIGATILLLFKKNFSFGSETIKGDLLVLLNSVSWAIYLVLAKPLLRKYPATAIMKWMFLFGMIYVIPFGYSDALAVHWAHISLSVWCCILFVVVVVTFITYFLNTYALEKLSPSIVSSYIYLQPVFATLIALFFGKDELNLLKIIAAIFIFFGVYMVSKPSVPQPKIPV